MKKLLLSLLFLSLAIPALGYPVIRESTGTVDVGSSNSSYSMYRMSLDWTSNATGEVSATIVGIYGILHRVAFNPGSASPSANYDLYLKDEDEVDIFRGAGENLSATASASYAITTADDESTPNIHPGAAVAGNLILSATNAGNAKQGRVTLYWR